MQAPDNGRRFRSAARKGDARAPQDTSPSEALARKQVHMAMVRWLILAAALVVAGATAAENLTSTRTELAPTGKLRVGITCGLARPLDLLYREGLRQPGSCAASP